MYLYFNIFDWLSGLNNLPKEGLGQTTKFASDVLNDVINTLTHVYSDYLTALISTSNFKSDIIH